MVDKDTEAAIIISKLEEQLADTEQDKRTRKATVLRKLDALEMAIHGVEKAIRDVRDSLV